jgi:hypothetical protein
MGTVPVDLARRLRDELGLVRGVETGTYLGDGSRLLASVFGEVVTIELSRDLAAQAARNLADCGVPRIVVGDSRDALPALVNMSKPTFWFLDGHYSGADTAGQDRQCPVLAEIAALASGHPDDCVVIDDARLFLDPNVAAMSGLNPAQWPPMTAVALALQEARPGSRVTVVDDQVICIPARAEEGR